MHHLPVPDLADFEREVDLVRRRVRDREVSGGDPVLHQPHGAGRIPIVGLPQAFGLQSRLLVLVGPVRLLRRGRAGRARVGLLLAEVCADETGFVYVSRRRRRRDRSDSLSRPRRPRPRGCGSDAAGRTERLDVLLLGLALPRRHGRARVVLDHGAEVTCGRFRVSRTSRGWLGVPAAVLQRASGFGCMCVP